MKKFFFCAKNIEDYRKIANTAISNKTLVVTKSNHKDETTQTIEEIPDDLHGKLLEQQLLFDHVKKLFKISDKFFEYKIHCETGIEGLRFDFNFGLQIEIPKGNYRLKISDADSGQIFLNERINVAVRLISLEHFFIRWQIEVFRDEEKIFEHTLDLKGRKVNMVIQGGLGDMLSIIPFVREFKRKHKCNLTLVLPKYMRELILNLYPELPQAEKYFFNSYATYYPSFLITWLGIGAYDSRNVPMERMGSTYLGLKTLPEKATFKPTARPVTTDPYVCIAVQASGTSKCWLYTGGWDIVVDYLKSLGYRVFCIDKDAEQTNHGMTVKMPDGAEDFTGDRPLLDRANMLHYADFFIGLGSGLAWLADAVSCPVVLICGFSQSWSEFYTPYRVANRLVCNGCFNDIRLNFLNKNRVCPRHHDTPRELECQKKIHPRQVINAINRLIADEHLTPPLGGI